MSSTAQILANRQNAERSHGPVTVAGKARVSQNATEAHSQPLGLPLCASKKERGLFSVANFVRPEEQDIFNRFETGYLVELAPNSPLEQTLAREIIQAAWRLRRCANLETMPPEDLDNEALDRLQISIDRARAAAQRTFHRSLRELRRLQSGHLEPAVLMIEQAKAMDALLKKDLEERQRQLTEKTQSAQAAHERSQMARLYPHHRPLAAGSSWSGPSSAIQESNFAKQTQSEPAAKRTQGGAPCHSSTSGFLDSCLLSSTKQTQSAPTKPRLVPRSAPCPCKSGLKYKRCCGKNAPPVLSSAQVATRATVVRG